MSIWSGILSGLGSVIAGGLNFVGAGKQNRAMRKAAKQQMHFQSDMAQRAMDFGQASAREQMGFQREMVGQQQEFQERMSNTAYQRQIADMKAAGLNPIMALNAGGASAPLGSSAVGASAGGVGASGAMPGVVNELGSIVSSAMEVKRSLAEIAQTKQLTKMLKLQQPGLENAAAVERGMLGKLSAYSEKFYKPLSILLKAVGR